VAYKDVVIPSEDGQLIQTGDEIPAGSDVSSNKDAYREDGERVHVLLLLRGRGSVQFEVYCGGIRRGIEERIRAEWWSSKVIAVFVSPGSFSCGPKFSVLVVLSIDHDAQIPAALTPHLWLSYNSSILSLRVRSTSSIILSR
jgi:hypothetical protein